LEEAAGRELVVLLDRRRRRVPLALQDVLHLKPAAVVERRPLRLLDRHDDVAAGGIAVAHRRNLDPAEQPERGEVAAALGQLAQPERLPPPYLWIPPGHPGVRPPPSRGRDS